MSQEPKLTSELLSSLTGQHPAHRYPFDELYQSLIARRNQGWINHKVSSDGLELFDYSNDCMFDGHWDLFTCISRGLVLDPHNKSVAAAPLPKFFNFGEYDCYYVPDGDMEVFEKFDGFLAIVFYDGNVWRVITRGSFGGEAQHEAQKLLDQYDLSALEKGYTYLFEALTKNFRIVISYENDELCLLTVFDDQGFECSWKHVTNIATQSNFKLPRKESFSNVDEVIKYTQGLDYTQEGFVIRFDNGYRCKIKSPEYLQIHRLIMDFGPLRVWEMLAEKTDLCYSKQQFPEEFWPEFDAYLERFESEFNHLKDQLLSDYERTKHLTNKELGQNFDYYFSSEVSKIFIFHLRNKSDFWERVSTPGTRERKGLFKMIRPVGNNRSFSGLEEARSQHGNGTYYGND